MNPNLDRLQPYPFEKLNALLADLTPPADMARIALSVGEPQHPPPAVAIDALTASLAGVARYPATRGLAELRVAIARWLTGRFALAGVDPESQVLPVNGTREALFAFAQAVVDSDTATRVMSPNPFYQIYEGAALLAGATPRFINCTEETGFNPDFDSVGEDEWQRCQLLYLCTPGNPTGTVLPVEQMQRLVHLADTHDFVIASDECYSEIYYDEGQPPPGLLQACAAMGRDDFRRCVVFHSLSKRSNLPGLRSGFVAGDAALIEAFGRYRTYHGCAMPLHHQRASIAAWEDEAHVIANRASYREKMTAVLARLDGELAVERPQAGFYLWPRTPVDDLQFTRDLYAHAGVQVLPGRYLARSSGGCNPGENRVRIALVAPLDDCLRAADRILACRPRWQRQC